MRSDIAPLGAPRGVHASPVDARTFSDDNSSVAILHWPDDRQQRAVLQARRRPRLLLIASGTPAPLPTDELEDWTRAESGSAEFDARIAELARRATPPVADVRLSDQRLQRGAHAVRLTATQCVTIAPLLRLAGRPVLRTVIADALTLAGTTPTSAAVRALLTRLDRAVAPLGLRVWLLSGQAVLLEVLPEPLD